MGDTFCYFVHFVLLYIIDQAFHVGCWFCVKTVVRKVLIGEEFDKEEVQIYFSLQLVKCGEG